MPDITAGFISALAGFTSSAVKIFQARMPPAPRPNKQGHG
jgi:hypothetical protein